MNRRSGIVLTILLILVFPVLARQNLYFQESAREKKFAADLEFFKSIPLREEGSTDEKKALNYIRQRLTENSIQIREYSYNRFKDAHSFSQGLEAYFPGSHPDAFLIICSITPLHDENHYDLALALSLAETIKQRGNKLTVRILFLGAEKGSGYPYPIGSRTFLDQFSGQGETAAMYLNSGSAPGTPRFIFGGRGDNAPEWLFSSIHKSFTQAGIPVPLKGTDFQIYRLNSAAYFPPSAFYLENGIPAFSLEQAENETILPFSAEKINNAVISFLSSFKSGFPVEWDRNYLVVTLGNRMILIKEQQYIIFFSLIVSLFLILIISQKRTIGFNVKRFKNYFWTLPLIICLCYIFLFLGTLYLQQLYSLKGVDDLWREIPAFSFLFKIAAAFILYNLFLQFIREVPLARSPHFYSYSAFAMVLVNLLITSILNINLSFYYIWFLLFLILFIASKKIVLRWITALIMPLFLVLALYLILFTPYPDICRVLLVSRIDGNWIFTLFLTPYILVLTSLNYHSHHYTQKRRNWLFILQTFIWLLLFVAAIGAIYFYIPFDEEHKQDVNIHEIINTNKNTRILNISSRTTIPDLHLEMDNKNYYLKDLPRVSQLEAEVKDNYLDVSQKYELFLGRKLLNLEIASAGTPELIKVEFLSDEPLSIYSCNYPYTQNPERSRSLVYIGKNPPNPLKIDLVFTEESSPDIKLNVDYSIYPYPLKAEGEKANINKKLTLVWQVSLDEIENQSR